MTQKIESFIIAVCTAFSDCGSFQNLLDDTSPILSFIKTSHTPNRIKDTGSTLRLRINVFKILKIYVLKKITKDRRWLFFIATLHWFRRFVLNGMRSSSKTRCKNAPFWTSVLTPRCISWKIGFVSCFTCPIWKNLQSRFAMKCTLEWELRFKRVNFCTVFWQRPHAIEKKTVEPVQSCN